MVGIKTIAAGEVDGWNFTPLGGGKWMPFLTNLNRGYQEYSVSGDRFQIGPEVGPLPYYLQRTATEALVESAPNGSLSGARFYEANIYSQYESVGCPGWEGGAAKLQNNSYNSHRNDNHTRQIFIWMNPAKSRSENLISQGASFNLVMEWEMEFCGDAQLENEVKTNVYTCANNDTIIKTSGDVIQGAGPSAIESSSNKIHDVEPAMIYFPPTRGANNERISLYTDDHYNIWTK